MKASLENTLLSLIRPVVRLCVKYGIKIVDLENVLKKAFVVEAINLLGSNNETESVSRISVITGMQRPAVKELIKSDTNNISKPKSLSLIMKVIGAWQTKSQFKTSQNKPRVLEFEGKQSEFAKLVHSVSQALNPYTVLFELERANLVEKSARGLKLLSKSFISNQNIEESLSFLSSDIEDLTFAVEENLTSQGNMLNHHLTTEYDNIPSDKINEVKSAILEEGEKFHARIRNILSSYDRDIINSKNKSQAVRVALCSFARCEEIKNKEGMI